jgi:hypothetical protein
MYPPVLQSVSPVLRSDPVTVGLLVPIADEVFRNGNTVAGKESDAREKEENMF